MFTFLYCIYRILYLKKTIAILSTPAEFSGDQPVYGEAIW